MKQTLIHLSEKDIAALDLKPSVLRSVLKRAFQRHAMGKAIVQPKQTLQVAPGQYFQSMSAVLPESGFAATKWIGVVGANAKNNIPLINGLVILSDINTGIPLATLDANALTGMRTAAMSALAAPYLARSDCTSIGFVGCGVQARSHLLALADALPTLSHAICNSRTRQSAENLAKLARNLGLEATVSSRADDVLGCDVIVTSLPDGTQINPALDAGRTEAGSFVCSVDLGRPWLPTSFSAFDVLVTDDAKQAADPAVKSKLAYRGPFDADLSMLAGGTHKGRSSARQRTLFLFPGFALADLAVAGEIYRASDGRVDGTGPVLSTRPVRR